LATAAAVSTTATASRSGADHEGAHLVCQSLTAPLPGRSRLAEPVCHGKVAQFEAGTRQGGPR
jgi:hypothetical protein